MERLTKIYPSGAWGIDGEIDDAIHRLADIEDILGDTYDLDRLRELVEACKGLEPKEIEESKLLIATRKDPEKIARVAELVNADKDGRCVVLPCKEGDKLKKDGFEFEADHWNIILTSFAKDDSVKTGERLMLFGVKEAEQALERMKKNG